MRSVQSPSSTLAVTGTPEMIGCHAATLSGRIHPRGLPTRYWFEVESARGDLSWTKPKPLGPRLAAHYSEDWRFGLSGWRGGMDGRGLQAHGGPDTALVRFAEPSGDDPNHVDGIGTLHLVSYLSTGTLDSDGEPSAFLGGGVADLRDAKVELEVRGVGFEPRGSELVWWIQSDLHPRLQRSPRWQRANWAFTGGTITGLLRSGKWEKASACLVNDPRSWSYAGSNALQPRADRYAYQCLDRSLGALNCNVFQLLAMVDPSAPPRGAIEFRRFQLTYRNRSLLYAGNGGRLARCSSGSPELALLLTDGQRRRPEGNWKSSARPAGPLEFCFSLAPGAAVDCVQVHQCPHWPSRELEASVSADGERWRKVAAGTLPRHSIHGWNFAFWRATFERCQARFFRLRILSGHRPEHWGLGGIELFGELADAETDLAWYNVNEDVMDLAAGVSYRVRLVAENRDGRIHGASSEIAMPREMSPAITACSLCRVEPEGAVAIARVCAMGRPTRVRLELGPSAQLGESTAWQPVGSGTTCRDVFLVFPARISAARVFFRIVAENDAGKASSRTVSWIR
jgi:hypothetical protein